MADISIRKTNGGHQKPQQAQQQGLQQEGPRRMLRDLMKWDPFSELAPLLGRQGGEGLLASFDVTETPDAFLFKADLPGFTEKDIDITAAGERLTISGTRQAEHQDQQDTYYVRERRSGGFSRAFTLPQGIDLEHVNAELKQGVLTVTVPRMKEAPPRKISVKSAGVKA